MRHTRIDPQSTPCTSDTITSCYGEQRYKYQKRRSMSGSQARSPEEQPQLEGKRKKVKGQAEELQMESRKRKKVKGQEEEPQLESSPSEMDGVSDSNSEFTINVKAPKRKRVTALGTKIPKKHRQKTKTHPSTSSSPSQPNTSSSPITPSSSTSYALTRRQKSKEGMKQPHAVYMFEAVMSGQSALVTVVDDWLEDYKKDREEGLLELVNFVVQCCGCKGAVTWEMFKSMQNADIISHLTKEFNEDSTSYPLVVSGTQGRRFREAMCEFPLLLVRRCQNSLLYDEFLFSSLLVFLTGLADSQVRAFRHTSTLIAMRLMSAVVEVATVVHAQEMMTQRCLQLEKSKSVHQRATEKLEELQNSYNELMEHQEELRFLMNGLFKGVFVHRYRDRVPDIRTICMKEMGVWFIENPTSFLNDGHLKYMGWMLNDKEASVRLQCVLALQKLYADTSFISRLELFTSRFKERVLNMVLDKDHHVAVETVKLLLLIKQGANDWLTEEECGAIYPLVFAEHRVLASAAGEFLYHGLYTEVGQLSEREDDKCSTAFLNLLTCFFIQSKHHEHATYLVDSLWSVAKAELTDWNTMISLLLAEREAGQGLEDVEEGALIEIMISAVRQAAEATGPTSRLVGKRNLGVKIKKLQAQDKRRITSHFLISLPRLLSKYSSDAEKVSSLLRAPLYFDLEVCASTGRFEKYLEMLLSQVCDIMDKHHDECVLKACVRVLCALCSDCYTFSSLAERIVSQFLDATAERFTAHVFNIMQGTADEKDMYNAAVSLRRLAVFSSARDLTAWNLVDPCLLLLTYAVESGEIEQELMISSVVCAAFHLLWKKVNVSRAAGQTDKADLKTLEKQVRSFCVLCQRCLSLGQNLVRNQAFLCLCDMLVIFGQHKDLESASFCPDDTMRAEIASYVMDYIFVDPENEDSGQGEDEITSLQRRRNHLAGYCKLILIGVLELRAAADILKCYNKFYRDFGDLIKEILTKSRNICPVESAKVVCLSLQQLFSSLGEERPDDMKEIRDLAKKLAMSFGVNLQHIRRPLLELHKAGIQFALAGAANDHSNLSFLEILSEFSFKLLKQDRIQLLTYLRQVCGSVRNKALTMYEHSLSSGLKKTPAVLSDDTPPTKRRQVEGSVRSLHSPALTSTVVSGRTAHTRSVHYPTASVRDISSEPSLVDSITEGLSLREKDFEEEEEEEEDIYEDEDSDFESVNLPTSRHSTSFLEDLFD
ncbi:cohesin subunit SA-3 isoform X2 [Brachyhypopomus gauderio]|uniref:cohesin subunit SA-3 isoform X2 n=2 Tax=Brachyhypopomus gauderio TaxID=698409 RepID=UPI004042A368